MIVLAWIHAANPASAPGFSWINAVLGLWLIVAPLGTPAGWRLWNDIIVGIGIAVFGAWSALTTPS